MKKIIIPKKALNLHKEYYKSLIVKNIDTINMDSVGRDKKLAFQKLIKMCKKNWEILAVGEVDELRILNKHLSKQWSKIRDDKEVDKLLKDFFIKDGYDKFCNVPNRLIDQWIKDEDSEDIIWCAYSFMKMLSNLQVCPYCNKHYIHPTLTKEGKVRGVLDHYFPKDKYPYFAMSIYNLIPCCGFCNTSLKGSKEFSENKKISPYEVSYDDMFAFKAPNDTSGEIRVAVKNKHDEINEILKRFLIKERYQNNRNILENYIRKQQQYGGEFFRQFNIEYGINNPRILIRKFWSDLYGYPINSDELNYDVLNKLKRDLAVDVLNHVWINDEDESNTYDS